MIHGQHGVEAAAAGLPRASTQQRGSRFDGAADRPHLLCHPGLTGTLEADDEPKPV